jgi:hypothetical protein
VGLGNEYLVLLLRSRSYDAAILELDRELTTRTRTVMPFDWSEYAERPMSVQRRVAQLAALGSPA